MKQILPLLFSTILVINLNARMNPFEPTDTFNEKREEYFKKIEDEKLKKLEEEKRIQEEKLAMQKAEEERLEKEAIEAEEVRLAQLAKIEEERRKALELEMAQQKAMEEAKKKKEAKKTYKALPFVKFEVSENILTIYIDKKYRLLNQDILEKQNKFLFNFRGKLNFYTYRKNLKNKNFKAIAVGNHPKYKYFRVVVDTKENLKNYTKEVDTKNNIVVIKKKQ